LLDSLLSETPGEEPVTSEGEPRDNNGQVGRSKIVFFILVVVGFQLIWSFMGTPVHIEISQLEPGLQQYIGPISYDEFLNRLHS